MDGPKLAAQVVALQERIGGDRRAALVLPTHWVKCFLVEAEELPRRRADLQDVLRWRLKKLLPVAVSELRIAPWVQSPKGGLKQVLCSAASEKALANIESAFEEADISIGLIVPRVLAMALSPDAATGWRIVLQQETAVLSMILVSDGAVRFIRSKPLPESGMSWSGVEREIGLALRHIRETMEITDALSVNLCVQDEEMSRSIAEWFEKQDGVNVHEGDGRSVCPDAQLAQTLGPARLRPMAAVLEGGAP